VSFHCCRLARGSPLDLQKLSPAVVPLLVARATTDHHTTLLTAGVVTVLDMHAPCATAWASLACFGHSTIPNHKAVGQIQPITVPWV
jgi:hypothetical protein